MMYILPTDTCFGIGCQIHDIDAYKKIYTLKKRGYEKPLAILVESLDFLKKHTFLTELQSTFLEKYRRPFTVLLETKTHFIDPEIPNRFLYKKVAFRIANMELQKKLLAEKGPIFLTSANISGEGEIYLKKDFPFDINDPEVELFYETDLEVTPPSDIFEFIGNTSKIIYLRKA